MVIVSNSLDVVVEAVARQMGVEWRASQLGYVRDRCTGRITEDLRGRKAAVLASLATGGQKRPIVCAYTENLSGRDLLWAADR